MRAGATPAACGRSRSNRGRAERCDGEAECSRRARVASSVPVADVGAVAFATGGAVGAHREDVESAAFARLAVLVRIAPRIGRRSEEHTSELQSLMRSSYAVFCLKKKNINELQQEIPQ